MRFPTAQSYRVKKGDTLSGIARRHYGDAHLWPEVARANHLAHGDLILVGQTLWLPALPAATFKPAACATPAQGRGANVGGATIKTTIRLPSSSTHRPTPFTSPAKTVRHPSIKVPLEKSVKVSVLEFGIFRAELSFKGELSLQNEGDLEEIEVTPKGEISASLRSEYESKLQKFTSSAGVTLKDGKLVMAFGGSSSPMLNGRVLATSEWKVTGLNEITFTYKPTPVHGTVDGLTLDGSLGYEVKFKVRSAKDFIPEKLAIPTWQVLGVGVVVIGVIVFGGEIIAVVAGITYEAAQVILAASSALAGLSRMVPAEL